jgi:iron complex outermembrane receptor protein
MKGAKVAALLVAICLCHGAFAQERQFELSAMDAVHGIPEFARQAGIQIVAPADDLGGISTPEIRGNFDVRVALKKLLVGTDLEIASDDGAVITLRRRAKAPKQPGIQDRSNSSTNEKVSPGVGNTSELTGAHDLAEIIVTAQKKTERLQDVPIPVSVVDTQLLAESNQVLLRDYYAMIPGLNVTPNIEGNQVISIRGITTGGFTTSTVGITVDDVPFGGSINNNEIPDFDPGDLARIEVLRGPQGTLYGDNSMGGLIKFVTVDPSPNAYSGRIEAGTSGVYNGAEPGFVVRASSNIPLSDSAAVRISAFSRQDSGYVDNPGNCAGVPCLVTKGINGAEVYGAHLAFLWRPSDEMSLKFSALYQDTRMNGQPDVISGLGNLQQNYIPFAGESDRRIQAYALTLKAKLWIGELTSITGYSDSRYSDSWDGTSYYGPFTQNGCNAPGAICPPNVTFNGFGVTGAPNYDFFRTEKVTQELRYSLPMGTNADWLIGAFYNHESSPNYQTEAAEDPVTGRTVGQWGYFGEQGTFREFAAFTDFTYRFTDQFDVQIGGRESTLKEINDPSVTTGIYVPVFYGQPSPYVVAGSEASQNVFTYVLTPRFKLSPDLMVYARLASGFRPGETNFPGPGVPPTFGPDKTENYELGFKGEFVDNRLSFDTSFYYIAWKDLQIAQFTSAGSVYTSNGGGAKSEGVELSVRAIPLTGLTLSGWVTFDDAVLTKPFPLHGSAYGEPGDRLPDSSRFSGNLSVQQKFPVGKAAGFVGAMASYVGNREGLFTGTPTTPAPRQIYPSYTKTDVRLGTEYESWTVSLYVTNLFDQRGEISGGLGYFIPQAFNIIPPRTIGLSVVKTFKR